MAARQVRCPQCGTLTEYRPDNEFRPFCSKRCKLIDLGAWAEGKYSIPGRAAGGEPGTGEGDGGTPGPEQRLDS